MAISRGNVTVSAMYDKLRTWRLQRGAIVVEEKLNVVKEEI